MIIAVSRKRTSGPGFPTQQVEIGRQKVWSKMSHEYVIDAPILATPHNGFYQVTWDNINPAWRMSNKRRRSSWKARADAPTDVSDTGGDFWTLSCSDEGCTRGFGHYSVEDGYSKTTYDGGFVPYSQHQYPGFNVADMAGMGTSGLFSGGYGYASEAECAQAWKKVKPKLYVADMGQFVGEIRETLPMLRTTASVFTRQFIDMFGTSMRHQKVMSKTMSNHWLNTQFGWKPFLNDLIKFTKKFGDLDRKLQQCIRDNGRFVRRRGVLSSQMDDAGKESYYKPPSVEVVESNGIPGWDTVFVQPFSLYNGLINPYAGHVKSTLTYTTKCETWFSACFRYWVPSFDSNKAVDVVSNYLRMFGLRITPTLIWNLTPWSWLVDWCGVVGDNIDNYTTASDDNLVAKYAYSMKTITTEIINESRIKCGGQVVSGLRWRRAAVCKTRLHASQFGFSTDHEEFNPWQWSILAALGFNRLKIESGRR